MGNLPEIDCIFCRYHPDLLQAKAPEKLTDEIKALDYANQNTKRQMEDLIRTNLPKMMRLEQLYGTIDPYYYLWIRQDPSMKLLILLETLQKTCRNQRQKYIIYYGLTAQKDSAKSAPQKNRSAHMRCKKDL